MIAAFQVTDSFTHREHFSYLEMNCKAFAEEFTGQSCQFFYYLKVSDPERFFFIRLETKERDKFIEAVKLFADNLDFVILSRQEIKPLLQRIDLDSFC